jgi:hypothetical protein
MPTSSFTKFEVFSENLAEKVHDLNADTLDVYASNAAPDAAADSVKTDLAEISTGNGYTAGGIDTQNATSRTGGTTSVTGVDITITASGGSIAALRYIPLFNDTPTSPADPLIGWWDYAASITIASGESLDIDFGASMFTVA